MKRQEAPIRFADLRQLTIAVPAYLAEQAGETKVPALRAGLEDKLGLTGLDTEEMIMGFAETYRVDYTEFDFTGLIGPEGCVEPATTIRGTILFFLLAAYFLLSWPLKAALSVLCWPFDSPLAKRIWQQQVLAFRLAADKFQPKALVIGDFVASAAVGRFVRREQVYFRLVR